VALARAFLRDSEIIILDEPTSAMDPKAEYELFKKFHELAKGRTAILISHRLSTVRMADSIYVLNDGKILESGTHDELVSRGGNYATLFETQAQCYR
jgi:ATP-binding cassette subfamily B protein